MESLGQNLLRALESQLGQNKRQLVRICQTWPSLVGQDLAKRSLPVRLDPKGGLTVRAKSSSAAQDIQHLKGDLMPRLAAFGVTSLRTKISSTAVSPETDVLANPPPPAVRDPQEVTGAMRKAWRSLRPTQPNEPTEETTPMETQSHDGADMAKKLREAFQSQKTETN